MHEGALDPLATPVIHCHHDVPECARRKPPLSEAFLTNCHANGVPVKRKAATIMQEAVMGPDNRGSHMSGRRHMPVNGDVGDTTPLRLAVAAATAFPDGSMTASGLRRECARGRLVIE